MSALWEATKPLLFRLDAERAHHLALCALRLAGRSALGRRALARTLGPRTGGTVVHTMGLRFAHPLGLAAGWDKAGEAGLGLLALGFSHVELGTVTRRAQLGNPRPRVFRVEEARALVNAMGFPNPGVSRFLENLERWEGTARRLGIIGVNIGKNKDTPNAEAGEELAHLVRMIDDRADYLTLNISSPNTPGLRGLSEATELERLLPPIARANQSLSRPLPLLLKVSPDDDDARLRDVAQIVRGAGLAGIVATNTTTRRDALPARAHDLRGGASGPCLAERSDDVLRLLRETLGSGLTLVGVGGVDSPARLTAKLRAGADLVQAFTGFVYEGPRFVRKLIDPP